MSDLLAKYNNLPPRTKEIIRMAISRPDLPLADVAYLIRMAIGTMRPRLHSAYRALGCSGRVELHARLAPLLQDVSEEQA